MKKIKYYLLFVVMTSMTFTSCLVDQDALSDTFDDGPNLVGFAESEITIGTVADGEAHPAEVPLHYFGPTSVNATAPVTVSVSVDPSSTAVEGVHYQLDATTVTIDPNNDVEENLPITVLTEGIETPADEIPVLTLNITEVSSDGQEVVIDGKISSVDVNLAYLCPFDINNLAGTYINVVDEFGSYLAPPKPFEIVVGPGENQITLINPLQHPEGYDIVIDVDPATGNLTVPKQVILNYNNFGATQYGELSTEATGVSAPTPGNCIGYIEFSGPFTVGAGSFGSYALGFERVTPEEGEGTDEGTGTEE